MATLNVHGFNPLQWNFSIELVMQLESFNELIIWMVFQVMAGFREEPLVLPFLWAQDGFSEPSGKFRHN